MLLFCLSVCPPVRLSTRLLVSGKIWSLCLVLASQMKSTRFLKCVYPPQSPQKAFLLKAETNKSSVCFGQSGPIRFFLKGHFNQVPAVAQATLDIHHCLVAAPS